MMMALFSLFLGLLSNNLIAANLMIMEGTKSSNSTIFVSTTNGRVGIQTNAPSSLLHIVSTSVNVSPTLTIESKSLAAPRLSFVTVGGSPSSSVGGTIFRGTSPNDVLYWGSAGDTGKTYSFGASTIFYSSVGINLQTTLLNATPSELLHISSGTIHLDGTGSPATGQALCINTAGRLVTCTSSVGAGGGCTCP